MKEDLLLLKLYRPDLYQVWLFKQDLKVSGIPTEDWPMMIEEYRRSLDAAGHAAQ